VTSVVLLSNNVGELPTLYCGRKKIVVQSPSGKRKEEGHKICTLFSLLSVNHSFLDAATFFYQSQFVLKCLVGNLFPHVFCNLSCPVLY
jgi:hypothetical protein